MPIASPGSPDASSSRSWMTLVTVVAVTSSLATAAGILGVQRLYRRKRREDLEERVRRAAIVTDSDADLSRPSTPKSRPLHLGDDDAAQLFEKGSLRATPQRGDSSTPRYLQALAVSQANTPSRSASPRPGMMARQGSLPLRPSSRGSSRPTTQPQSLTYDESLIREQLSRNYSFLGEEAMSKLRDSFVIVVGAGGVGSWAALMLLRSGVGRLRLIDFDQVSLSSLNRHACANLADVGRPKVLVCKEKFAEIAPWAEVEAVVEIFKGNDAARLLGPASHGGGEMDRRKPAYVVDAIDNIDTKVDLLEFCYRRGIKCFSSMGAGAKADPSTIQIADLNTTAEDPLARSVRRGLRSRGVWGAGVFSKDRKGSKKRQDIGSEHSKKANEAKSAQKKMQELDKKQKADQREAIDKMESGFGMCGRKFEHSGRGAGEGQKSEAVSKDKSSNFADQQPNAVKQHSRRASSASSMGSAQFFSPMSSPEVEKPTSEEERDESGGSYLRDSTEGEKQNPQEELLNAVPDAAKEQQRVPELSPPAVSETESQETSSKSQKDDAPQRPALSTLTSAPPKSQMSSTNASRTSSLKELVAEDMRSSRAGQVARSSMSGRPGSLDPALEVEERDQKGSASTQISIMCVFSTEKSDTRLLPLDEEEFQKGNVEELAALEDFRVRILPVLGPLPAMFGLAAATYIICDIAGRKQEPLPFKNRRKTYERLWTDLEKTERQWPLADSGYGEHNKALGPRRIPWSLEDVAYLFEEVFRGKSIVPPYESLQAGRFCRWDSTLPLSYSNVALFTRSQGDKHEREVLKAGNSPVEVWGDDTYGMWKRRMAEERRMGILR